MAVVERPVASGRRAHEGAHRYIGVCGVLFGLGLIGLTIATGAQTIGSGFGVGLQEAAGAWQPASPQMAKPNDDASLRPASFWQRGAGVGGRLLDGHGVVGDERYWLATEGRETLVHEGLAVGYQFKMHSGQSGSKMFEVIEVLPLHTSSLMPIAGPSISAPSPAPRRVVLLTAREIGLDSQGAQPRTQIRFLVDDPVEAVLPPHQAPAVATDEHAHGAL